MTQGHFILLCRMKWTGKAKLEYFADELKRRKCIRYKKEIYALFEKPRENTIVRWDFDKLELLACLLHRFINEEYIRMIKTKGYFLFAESHFTDFEGNKMRKNALKYQSCQINLNKSRYAAILAEVDDIIASISKR